MAGTINMEKPVAMPIGGIIIFFADVGLLVAFNLNIITVTPINSDMRMDMICAVLIENVMRLHHQFIC